MLDVELNLKLVDPIMEGVGDGPVVIVADALYDSQSKAVAFLALRAVEAGENVILIKG